ncbi:MAG: metallophosphoesterase family protein [Acidobacteria bacterium]|nr:metallophosphoesterase family protein [Acidobacteriota bacterium]
MNRSAVITRGPYLQLGTPTGVVVRWRTELPVAGIVHFGSSAADLSKEASEGAPTAEHVVPISGLTPASPYYYAVEGSPAGAEPFSFVSAPVAGSDAPIRVWVLGDSGTAKDPARAVRDAYLKVTAGKRTDLWLMLGDNAYPDGTDRQYQAAVFRMYPAMLAHATLWPAVGNHDAHSRSTGGSGVHGEIFTLPTRGEAGGAPSGTPNFYSFDWGNVHFISLDSCTDDRSVGGPMLTWLQADLAAAHQEWLVAYFHHAPYAKGSEDSDHDRRMTDMRSIALPLLEEAGADLVMGGHSHDYERSFLLDGHYGPSGTFTASARRDGGDGREDGSGVYSKPTRDRRPHQGTVYIVAGSSGHTGSGPMNHPAMFTSQKVLGSVMLEFHGDRLDESFIDSNAAVRDHFTIVKGAGKR